MNDAEFMQELTEIVQELNDLIQGKPEEEDDDEEDTGINTLEMGGMKVEDELKQAQDALAAALAQVAELEAKLGEATETITALAQENDGYKRQALATERTAKIVEAGIKIDTDQEKLAAKQELWLAMSPEIFEVYVNDLAEASKPATPPKDAAASKKENLPKFTSAAGQETTIDDLKAVGRRASRGIAADL